MMYFRYFTGAVDNTSVRLDQVNLLAYGPDRPYFKQKQKKNIFQHFDQLAFLIYYFLLFFKKNIYIQQTYQDAFIAIIINYKSRFFLLCLLYKISFLKNYRPEESNNIIFLPTDRPYFFNWPVDQITWFHLIKIIFPKIKL